MEYRFKNGKYVINKDGAYLAISPEQAPMLLQVAEQIAADAREPQGATDDKPLPHAVDRRGTPENDSEQ